MTARAAKLDDKERLAELREVVTPWLNYAEAAHYLRLSVSTLHHYVSARQIPVYGRPRQRRFRKDMLDLWSVNQNLALRKWRQEVGVGY